ncbi:MAG: hypothetical protein KGJ07_02175, partial [Patescibacteria group bacterium]|nr:hypothetical protein [Patescibacteria group bacterium]
HHSLGDFLRLQKYIISFYAKSRLKVHHDAFWITILFGKFPDIVSGVWGNVKEWWFLWPAAFLFGLFQVIRKLLAKSMSLEAQVIVVFILFSAGVFSIIPFYPRYFLILVPFIYLFAFSFFAMFKKNIMGFMLIAIFSFYGFLNTYLYVHQNPQDTVNAFSYNLSHGYFQDIYQEDINAKSKAETRMDRNHFFIITHSALTQAAVRSVAVKILPVSIPFWATSLTIPLSVTYYTQDLGIFSQTKQLHLVKEHGQWKVVWSWDLLFNKFVPGDALITTVIPGKRGSIIDQKGNVLAQDENGFLVSVISDKIETKREQDMLALFQKIAGKKAVHLQDAYLENAMPSEAIPVFTNFATISTQEEQQLSHFPGVSFAPSAVRVYSGYSMNSIENTMYSECCSRIYSSWSYHGITGFEKQYDKVLSGYDGGSLQLRDRTGNTVSTFIQKDPKNGQDVSVSL